MQPLPFCKREHALRVEREEDDRRARNDGAQSLLAGMQHLVLLYAFGDVTRVDDHAVRIGLILFGLPDRLQDVPGAVGVPESERRRVRGARSLDGVGQRFHHRCEIVGMHELERIPAQQLFGAVPEQALDRGAHISENAIITENRDDVRGVFGQ